jgi:23S rRNA (adenine2503-C2)-methyltransferase
MNIKNLLNMTLSELESEVFAIKQPTFRAKQICNWLYKKKIYNIDLMFNLALSLRRELKKSFNISLPLISKITKSESDHSYKFLLKTHDQRYIETVLMSDGTRATVCVSCMIGCPLKCKFCASGTGMKYVRKLNLSEIIGQVIIAEQYAIKHNIVPKVTNVVFMGMGEPLLNYDNVGKALEILMSDYGFSIPRTKITVSTVGIPERLAEFFNQHKVRLALSLHFVDDELRQQFMPIAKNISIKDLISTLQKVELGKKDYITIEYLMIKDVNDKKRDAKKLVKLFANLKVKINLVPLNPVKGFDFEASSEDSINDFVKYLWSKKIVTTVRRSKGRDVSGACGQLASDQN